MTGGAQPTGSVLMLTVSAGEAGMRLDRWFRTHFPAVRHGELEKLLRTGQVRVDGGRVKSSRRLESGEAVRVPPLREAEPLKAAPAPRAEDRDFLRGLILYEDDALIAFGKPSGLAVQGGEKTTRHIDGMLGALAGDERPRLVHRLDRDTSGLLIVARTRAAAASLGAAFQRHEVEKTYWALVAGAPRPRQGTIDLPVAKRKAGAERREIMAADDGDDARPAVTDYQIVDEAAGIAFLALRPRTGRTHQIRVHCAAIGAPVVGDAKYGGAASRIDGLAPRLHLFCREMTFPHPRDGRLMTLAAPLGGHMLETFRLFGFAADAKVAWPPAAGAGR